MMLPKRAAVCLMSALLFSGLCARADDLGRLFTTPGERARIDDLRAGRTARSGAADPAAPVAAAERIILNGTVTGSDGKRLAWINGAPVDAAHARDLTLLRDGEVRLQLRDGALKRDLKPGQGVDTASGQVFETYQRAAAASVASKPDAAKPAASQPVASKPTAPAPLATAKTPAAAPPAKAPTPAATATGKAKRP